MAPFYILGGVLAAWALIVTALGVMSKDFPGSKTGERAVSGISIVLVVAAIGAGIITAANEEEEPGDEAHAAESAEEAAGEGGAQAPADAEEGEAPAGAAPEAAEDPADGQTLELSTDPGGSLAYTATELEASAGPVEIVMDNPSPVPHNVAIDGGGVDEKGEIVGEGEKSTVTADLEPGEYAFYCSVPGHRQGGMEGTLTVE